MFDIGAFELLLILIVGLLVIGPERLPEVARNLALWTSRLKRGFHDARVSFEREIGADEIRREIHNDDIMHKLNEAKENVHRAVDDTGDFISDIDSELSDSAVQPTKELGKPKDD